MREQYWAQIIEVDAERSAICVMTDTLKSAAEVAVEEYIEATAGEIKFGVVRVWEFDQPDATAQVFTWQADFEMPEDPDVSEEGEFEVEASITLAERG